MTTTEALRDGMRRVNGAPALIVGMALFTFAVALPLAVVVEEQVARHLGASTAGARAAAGVDYDWWQEFLEQAAVPGSTLTPSVIGFAAPLRNLSMLLDDQSNPALICTVATAYALIWVFLIGGVIDRLSRNRRTRAHGFFAASGTFFFRFLRLGALALLLYLFLYGPMHRWLFEDLYEWWTRDFTSERSAFLVRLVLYLAFATQLAVVVVIFDYAKIRAVVEDRRSALSALSAGFRFVRRRPRRVAALYLMNVLLFLVVLAVYALVAPGAGRAGASAWLTLIVGQLFLLARIWTKLVFYASAVAFFQSELAHAEFTAAPPVVWPESPDAEAILNAATQIES